MFFFFKQKTAYEMEESDWSSDVCSSDLLHIAGAVAALLGLSSPAALAVPPPSALKTVTYLGYEFAVPASWPVIDTARTSTTCVRFDRHAIYLGDPGQNQDCPSGLLGTTEAILVQPAAAPVSAASAAEDQASRRITVVSPGIEVTATYDTDLALVEQIGRASCRERVFSSV